METQHPKWREYPSAVSEGIVYVGDVAGVPGKARYRAGPDTDEHAIRAKGDYVPDFDYAAFSFTVFEELRDRVDARVDPDTYDTGTILLRFVAFNRDHDWSIETAHGEVEDLIRNATFRHLDTGSPPNGDESDEKSLDDLLDQYDETLMKVAERTESDR